MIDKLVLHIPVDSSLVDITEDGNYCVFGFDLLDTDLKCGAMMVYKDEYGNIKHAGLKHPFETLPTSFTTMAFKFYHESKVYPYVELKCSPAKIMQGHNVYGSDWIEQGALEMLGYLLASHPTLFGMLCISETQVKQIDVTYSCRLKDNQQVDDMLDMFRNLSTQHVRRSTKQVFYENTVYWGSERCKRWCRKIYGKAVEYMNQLKEYAYEAKCNNPSAKRVFDVMSQQKLIDYTQGLLRLEVGVKAYKLKEENIPTNLLQLIQYQRQNPDVFMNLWLDSTSQIFKALKGEVMDLDSKAVHERLRSIYHTITPKGNISYIKADNLYNFYCALEKDGFEQLKKFYQERTFYRNIKMLIDAGFSRLYLQNLHNTKADRAVPIIELVKFDLTSQVPADYIEPQSMFRWSDLGLGQFERYQAKAA